jgi:hypothetical protein
VTKKKKLGANNKQSAQAHEQIQTKIKKIFCHRNQNERKDGWTATTGQDDQPATTPLRPQVLSLNEQNIHQKRTTGLANSRRKSSLEIISTNMNV